MTTFSDAESGASVREKINAAITLVDSLGSGDNLLMTAAEKSKLAATSPFVIVTQAEYDALTPDTDTVYLITGVG